MNTCLICGRPAKVVKRDVLDTIRADGSFRTVVTTEHHFCDQHVKQAVHTLHCEVCATPMQTMERDLIEIEPEDGWRRYKPGIWHAYCRRHAPKSKSPFDLRRWWFRHVAAPLHIWWLKLTGRIAA